MSSQVKNRNSFNCFTKTSKGFNSRPLLGKTEQDPTQQSYNAKNTQFKTTLNDDSKEE